MRVFILLFIFALTAQAAPVLLPGTPAYRECLKILRGENAAAEWVDAPVKGLYESIPATKKIANGEIEFVSIDAPSIRGYAAVKMNPREDPSPVTRTVSGYVWGEPPHELALENVFVQDRKGRGTPLPKFVQFPSVKSMTAQGTPTAVFATLFLLRAKGVRYGSLTEASLNKIVEPQTGLELLRFPEFAALGVIPGPDADLPGSYVERYFLTTQMGRYLSTSLIQSGHRIVSVRATARVPCTSISELIKNKEIRPSEPVFSALLAGVPENACIPNNFSIELQLEPWRPEK